MDTQKLQVLKYPDENNSKRILAVSDANTGGDVLAYVEREMKTGALAELAHRWNMHEDLMDLCNLVIAGNTEHEKLETIAEAIVEKHNPTN